MSPVRSLPLICQHRCFYFSKRTEVGPAVHSQVPFSFIYILSFSYAKLCWRLTFALTNNLPHFAPLPASMPACYPSSSAASVALSLSFFSQYRLVFSTALLPLTVFSLLYLTLFFFFLHCAVSSSLCCYAVGTLIWHLHLLILKSINKMQY